MLGLEPLSMDDKVRILPICDPNDRIEAPIIACNHTLPANRIRRPSTPSKLMKPCPPVSSSGDRGGRKGRDDKSQGSRIRSASAGRDIKSEMCSRYWSYLFENLERSISEIYEGCEKEENIRQCQEVLLFLDNYSRDFNNLIQWFNIKWSYEKTPPPMRPAALAWEIRKPTLCLLPHTLAYEKLVGLKDSVDSKSKSSHQNPKGSGIPLSSNATLVLETVKGLSSVSNPAPVPPFDNPVTSPPTDNTINDTRNNNAVINDNETSVAVDVVEGMCRMPNESCHGSHKLSTTQPAVSLTNDPLGNSNTDKTKPSCNPFLPEFESIKTVEIGLQTDLEEDPDIWYFPGGRTVASQTDYSEEYGPLTRISFDSTPVILVLNTSDSDMESSFLAEKTGSTDICPPFLTSTSNTPVVESYPSPLMASLICESSLKIEVITNPITTETINNKRPPSPIGTKSSATQLSAGVLIDEVPAASFKAKDEELDKGTCSLTTSQSSAPEVLSPSGSVKSTFLEKAKTGMLRHNQNQAKSVSSYLNKIGVPKSGSATSNIHEQLQSQGKGKNMKIGSFGGSQGGSSNRGGGIGGHCQKVKVPAIPNYRSNIASRCRTAVNMTGSHQTTLQQQDLVQVNKCSKMAWKCGSASSATSPASPAVAIAIASGGGEGGSNNIPTSLISGGTRGDKSEKRPALIKGEINSITKKSVTPSKPSSSQTTTNKKKQWKGHQQQQPKIPLGQDSKSGPPGMARSKSMINPPNVGKDEKKGKKLGLPRLRGGVPGNYSKGPNSDSYVSLPDESKRKSDVDDDGWETVKARSSRSKWSSSNSSIASLNANNSRSSLEKGFVLPKNLTKSGSQVESKDSETNKDNFDENRGNVDLKKGATVDRKCGKVGLVDDEVDDEEIKKKEADLDDAIREEELLEQELLQVEKDFERIEKDQTEDSTITDSEHATSPEVVDVDVDLENEHFFFVSMDDEEIARMEELPPRETGRILSLREKLMSPAKKCDGAERLRRYEAKLLKAERNREKLLQSKFNRYVELSDRFEALNETTKKLVSERAELIMKAEERRRRAGEKRQQYLKSIRRKAHDEDSKAKEIAFINLLEAQNKRHDYLASAQEVEDRLQTIQEERRVKLEERAGKASGVIQRQSHIKKDWQAKLEDFQEKRRKADERIRREKEERAKERTEMAIEKARDREVRMCALNAAKQAEKEKLEKKIRRKQEDTARRHEENMEQIRQKAIELSAPRIQEENSVPSSLRICTLCKIIMQSEVQELGHLRGRPHLEAVKKMEGLPVPPSSPAPLSSHFMNGLESFGLKFIADVQPEKLDCKIVPDKNRQKAAKKHTKKLLLKLITGGREFEKAEKDSMPLGGCTWDSVVLTKTRRNILELGRLIQLFEQNKGSASAAITMDRLMSDIRRAAVKTEHIKDWIIWMSGVSVAERVLNCAASDLPIKLKVTACEMLQGFVLGHLKNGLYILRGTAVCTIINLCAERWNCLIPDDNRWLCGSPIFNEPLPTDPLIESLVALLFNLLGNVPDPFHGVMKKGSTIDSKTVDDIKNRTHDIISYLVASSVVDRISVYCGGVRGPVDNQPGVASLLQIFMDFLVVLVYALQFCWGVDPTGCVMNKKDPDKSQLLATLEASELGGAVAMSYSLLLHQGAPSRPRTVPPHAPPPPPLEKTAQVVKSTLCLINAMARLDLIALQNVLGSEAVSLQFRHIASQLLWQIVPHRESYSMRRLLTELIIALGNFTVGNKDNQAKIQSGQTPTVLQMLCTLPSEYFTDAKYSHNFFPTLLAATHGSPENTNVLLRNNIDIEKLDAHLNSEEGKKNVIVKRLIFVTRVRDEAGIDGTAISKSKKGVKAKKSKRLSMLKTDENYVANMTIIK